MKKIQVLLVAVIALAFSQSCQKSEKVDTSSSANLDVTLKAAVSDIVSNTVTQTSLQDLQGICIEKYDGLGEAFRLTGNGLHGIGHFQIPRLNQCATITVSDSIYPKEIVVEYDSSCTDHRNHTISGKIIINISDSLNKAGAVKTVVFQDFYIDSVKVELNAYFKNIGLNADSNWVLQSSTDQVITLADGTVINQTNQGETEWLSGFSTVDKDDDVYLKSGSGSINIDDSITYSRNITTPLRYDWSCDYISSGVVELLKDGSTVVIDYGDGTCDSTATVTTDGITEEISLKSYKFGDKGKFGQHCHGIGHGQGNGHGGGH
jgi:hypothetical protein